jgi:hypothetical protein
MADALAAAIEAAQAEVTKQGDTVRSLKASLKDGKAEKVRAGVGEAGMRGSADRPAEPPRALVCRPTWTPQSRSSQS